MASKQSQQRAAQALRDIDRLAKRGVRIAKTMSVAVRTQSIAAFIAGSDVGDAAREALSPFDELLRDDMIAAHLTGRFRQEVIARKAKRSRPGIVAAGFDDAIAFLTRRLQLTDDELQGLEDLYGPVATRIVDENGVAVARQVDVAVRDAVREGLTQPESVARIRAAFDAAGVTVENPFLFEQIFRTQSQMAYAAGEDNAWKDPALDRLLWGFEYVAVGDDRVRPEHAGLDATRLPKDDPFWRTATPPNGFNCRCRKVAILKGDKLATVKEAPDVIEIKINGRTERIVPGPDQGFDFNPGDVLRDTLTVGDRV